MNWTLCDWFCLAVAAFGVVGIGGMAWQLSAAGDISGAVFAWGVTFFALCMLAFFVSVYWEAP